MPTDRWARVEAIYHAALSRDARDRGEFLDNACAGDIELCQDVEELLAFSDTPSAAIQRPIAAIADQVLQDLPRAASDRRSSFVWVVAAIGVAIVVAHGIAIVGLLRHAHPAIDLGWSYGWDHGRLSVNGSPSASAGPQRGDRIVAVNGDARARMHGFGPRLLLHPGMPYRLRVERDRRQLEFTLVASAGPPPRPAWAVISLIAVSGVWSAIGLFIGFSRPDRVLARLACIACLLMSTLVLNTAILARFEPSSGIFWSLQIVLNMIWPWALPVGYHTLARFPERVPRSRFWSALVPAAYLAQGIVLVTHDAPYAIAFLSSTDAAAAFITALNGWLPLSEQVAPVVMAAIGVAIIAVVVRNFRASTDADDRRRIRVFIWSAVVGVAPNTALMVVASFDGRLPSAIDARTVGDLADVATVAAAAGLAYGIARHQVFDIALVFRRGVQYVLATNAVRALVAIPVVFLAYAIVSHPTQDALDVVGRNPGMLALLAVALAALASRSRVLRWVDTRFFREAVDRERVLSTAITAMRGLDTMAEVASYMSGTVDEALHPKTSAIWAREIEEDELTLVECSGPAAAPARIHKRDEPVWIRQRHGELCVPITGSNDALLGFIALGEKKSEQSYTDGDRLLVEALAQQAGMIGDNLRLSRRVGEERRVREEVLAAVDERRLNLMKECPHCGRCYDDADDHCSRDGRLLSVSLPIGRTLDGKYRLNRLVGRGGMGAVYEAEDLRLNRTVAAKIMLLNWFGDAAALRRFEREARATAQLQHPNIVSVFDVGRVSDRGAYLVMEFVAGETLRSVLARSRVLPPAVVADWFDQICDAAREAHGHGIIHRDLKPENVMVAGNGTERAAIKLVDFGVAKLRAIGSDGTAALTAANIVGTLGYMSPEQLVGDVVDERTDVFAIGVMAIEALVGQRPFDGRTPADMLMALSRDDFELPASDAAGERLAAALKRCIARDRLRRFSSILELQAELIPALRGVTAATVD